MGYPKVPIALRRNCPSPISDSFVNGLRLSFPRDCAEPEPDVLLGHHRVRYSESDVVLMDIAQWQAVALRVVILLLTEANSGLVAELAFTSPVL